MSSEPEGKKGCSVRRTGSEPRPPFAPRFIEGPYTGGGMRGRECGWRRRRRVSSEARHEAPDHPHSELKRAKQFASIGSGWMASRNRHTPPTRGPLYRRALAPGSAGSWAAERKITAAQIGPKLIWPPDSSLGYRLKEEPRSRQHVASALLKALFEANNFGQSNPVIPFDNNHFAASDDSVVHD